MLENYRGAIIRTPGPAGTIHEGIVYGADRSGTDFMIENSKVCGQVVISTLQEFCGGGSWEIVQPAPAGLEDQIISRALNLRGRPYDVIDYNCQHFVSEVYTGSPSSWQLPQFGLLVGLIALAILPGSSKRR